MANSFEFIQQRPTIQNALDQAHGLGLDNIAFDTFVDVGDRDTIWKTLFSDGILTFESDYNCPFKHIAATIEPVQSGSGDPSPDNVRPISGWTGAEVVQTGVNVWDEETESGYINSDGSYGTNENSLRSKNFCPCVGGEAYYFVKPSTYTTTPNICWYDSEQNFISRSATSEFPSIHAPSNAKYFKISMWAYGATYNHDVSINYPRTDTSYHAYTGDSLSINWQDEAGTVYGGTIAIDEDGSCKLTVDKYLYVYDGTELFLKSGTALNGFYNVLNAGTPPHNWPCMLDYGGVSQITDECSSMFRPTRNVNLYKQNYGYVYFDSGQNFNVPPEIFGTTADSFKAKLAELYTAGTPVSVFCKISTPIIYTLPSVTMLSSLLGINNIWASTGGIAVTYKDTNPIFLTDPLNVGVMTLK